MKKKLLKAAGMAAAPKLMLALKYPKKAAFAKAGKWAATNVLRQKKRSSVGTTAAKGLGAAAVAVPLGMLLGRWMRGRGVEGSR